MNEQIDEAAKYHLMTFDPAVGEENRRRIERNINDLYTAIADRAKDLADQMEVLIDREAW